MVTGAAVRSAWFDLYTVSSSILPLNTPVTLTLRVDLSAALQAEVNAGYSVCDGTGNPSACAQAFAAFCESYDGCYYSGQWPRW